MHGESCRRLLHLWQGYQLHTPSKKLINKDLTCGFMLFHSTSSELPTHPRSVERILAVRYAMRFQNDVIVSWSGPTAGVE